MQQQRQYLTHFKVQELVLCLSPLQFNQQLVSQIEKLLGLSFLNDNEPHRVCFANQNIELQDAYKQVFSPVDLLDYLYASLIADQQSAEKIQLDHPALAPIPYPTDNLTFWKMVATGRQYRLSLS
ncbi:hypothetical protein GCM10025882_04530 [Acinetobacter gyllenbergii]|uniref:Uncharacterized protein n=1 Tax=Acinetobacter gyllenbergii CIP 110306 = MTCC 11365 TaxID=1217657 RepID=A0A829HGX8_9GAMM|nr:hypothetical protein [Acinetobacter gyllenbergii]EPF76050.1 hypothetical protein F957_02895 [Acinetobacter gyllenbergii CIP 110306 = MTCC 11365]EPH33522.1 hypothetical protein L293_0800 [Acinetobacter gyllenbergii CIP 110306 = MTCC 11365]ESK36905.1 hypothetical protein F987_03721 [Acinetobacter gyllenbergii NIPH 230]GMA10029.1 hypothetical protein GCM10025882_04530 [Acinetobacter gyllenbergii]